MNYATQMQVKVKEDQNSIQLHGPISIVYVSHASPWRRNIAKLFSEKS